MRRRSSLLCHTNRRACLTRDHDDRAVLERAHMNASENPGGRRIERNGTLRAVQDRYTLSALLRGRRSLGSRRLECIPFGTAILKPL